MGRALTPGGATVLRGTCFGARSGRVEIIGQFANSNLRPAFTSWTDQRIELQMPSSIRGIGDHAVAVTVVSAEGLRSAALQGRLLATRERLEVSERVWRPGAGFMPMDIDQGGGGIFSGYKVWGAGVGTFVNEFRVVVSEECALEDLELPTQHGHVVEVRGWDAGPPNEFVIQVVWSPACTIHSTEYLVTRTSERICSADIRLRAWASCPVGRTP